MPIGEYLRINPGEPIWADGVVVTGTGPPIRVHGQPHQHPRVLDGRSYWLAAPANGHMAINACAWTTLMPLSPPRAA